MSDRLGGNAAAAHTGAQHGRGSAWAALLTLAVVLGLATSAPALIITGGPVYAGSGGVTGSCTVSGNACLTGGATVTCTGLNASAFSNLYYGIRNDVFVNGVKEVGSGGPVSGVDQFKAGTASITYTGTTLVHDNITASNLAVNTKLVLAVTSVTGGSVSVVPTGGNPSDNGRGDIDLLFRLSSGATGLTMNVKVQAQLSPGSPSAGSCPTVFDPTHTTDVTDRDVSHVDLGFYFSSCGDGMVDSPEQCDLGGSNGAPTSCCSATCTYTTGNTCRATAGVCDVAETCPGGTITCPADGKSTALCRAAATTCDAAEFCDGAGNDCPADTYASSSTVCRAAGGACDIAEFCDGVSPTCPTDAKSTAECRAPGGVCDVAEVCDGVSNACPADAKSTALCRGSVGVCDVDDFCDGVNNDCPTDAKSTALCRGSGGVCDVADFCDGVNDDCPADAKSAAVCRAAVGGCDVAEVCDGAANDCPSDQIAANGATCRAAAGGCDVAETCDGVSTACPADALKSGGTECRAVAGVCDVAEQCDGVSADCPPDAFEPDTTVCRASSVGEVCDVPESCTGSSADCPADAVEPNTTECRASAGDCDIAETCDGATKTCPADALEPTITVCRAASSGETCDAAETCDGVNPVCPPDGVLPGGTTCRAAAGACDAVEECDGSSKLCPSDSKSTATCRAAVDACDVAEVCDGVSDDCPADALQPDNTSCEDGSFCNGAQVCTGGVCGGGSDPCALGQSCDEVSDLCFVGSCPVGPASCLTAQKNKVLIKNKTPDDKDKLVWKWTKGAETTLDDVKDPTTTADYALCFYAGTTSALIQQISVPAGANWATAGSKGYKYKDKTGSVEGIVKIIVKSGAAGKSKALVKGKGINLPDFDGDLPIADLNSAPLIVQLRNNESGMCWEGAFDNPKKNQADQFNAKE